MQFGDGPGRRLPTDNKRLVKMVVPPSHFQDDPQYDIIVNNTAAKRAQGRRFMAQSNAESEQQPWRTGRRKVSQQDECSPIAHQRSGYGARDTTHNSSYSEPRPTPCDSFPAGTCSGKAGENRGRRSATAAQNHGNLLVPSTVSGPDQPKRGRARVNPNGGSFNPISHT